MMWPLLIICIFLPTPVTRDMTALYPGPAATVEGWNYSSDPPTYSALHFTRYRSGWWQQSNSADGCHFDTFQWTSALTYISTTDTCGAVRQDTTYNPPIPLMPRAWDGERWARAGRSTVTDYANGEGRCRGYTDWRAEVHGVEQITPGESAVHVSTEQTTTWTHGPCAPWVTEWREDYYYTDHLRRSVGGNVDGSFRWDVWYDR